MLHWSNSLFIFKRTDRKTGQKYLKYAFTKLNYLQILKTNI